MTAEMTLMEHLNELRTRIFHVVIAVVIITVFVMSFDIRPVEYAGIQLAYPFPDTIHNISARLILFMQHDLLPPNVTLVQNQPGQAFFAQVYVSILIGLIGAVPVIAREISGFISPAISSNARAGITRVFAPSIALFLAGVIFSYLVVIPFILDFLYQYGEAIGAVPLLNISDFLSFVLQFVLGFGISFQLPVLMYGISLTGMISSRFWRNNLRYAIIVIVIFGAAITPDGSGITMWFIAIPMMALYLGGMFVVERRAKRMHDSETNT
jgi:sec-independent protein translocase protein TatC